VTLPLHELAAFAAALCWAVTGLFAADAVRALGPFYFNLSRQLFIAGLLALIVFAGGHDTVWPPMQDIGLLVLSGWVGILLGDSALFAAVARLGPRRAGALFALNAPIAALLGWAILGETLAQMASLGILMTAAGVALAIMGRPAQNAHRFEMTQGALWAGVALGLCAALGQAAGSLIARPVMMAGMDPYLASMLRVGASGVMMALALPLAPPRPIFTRSALIITAATAVIGLLLGMTLFLFALHGGETGIVATLSATSPVLILPLLWLRTGQRPSGLSWAGAILAVAGLSLIFLR
jgi:drug/metabolite transporter (DMT)-like permease